MISDGLSAARSCSVSPWNGTRRSGAWKPNDIGLMLAGMAPASLTLWSGSHGRMSSRTRVKGPWGACSRFLLSDDNRRGLDRPLAAAARPDHGRCRRRGRWLGSRRLLPAARDLDSSERSGRWYNVLISRAAAPPTPRAYQSALRAVGIQRRDAASGPDNDRPRGGRRDHWRDLGVAQYARAERHHAEKGRCAAAVGKACRGRLATQPSQPR